MTETWLGRGVTALAVVVLVTAGIVGYLWLGGRGAPSGYEVAYVSDAGGGSLDLYLADHEGRRPIRLTETPEDEIFPAWSPDGERLAFVRVGDWMGSGGRSAWGDREGLYLLTAQGRSWRERRLVGAAEGGVGRPAWSPDGRYVAVIGTPEQDSRGRAMPLVIYDTQEHTVEAIPTGLAVESITGRPAWSPDGSALAFVATLADRVEPYPALWLYRRGSGELARLAPRGEAVAWSGSGELFVAVSGEGGGLYAVDPGGGEPAFRGRPWGEEGGIAELAPSPDGSLLAVALVEEERGLVNIVNGAGDVLHTHDVGEYALPLAPTWSPDGRYVALWRLRLLESAFGAEVVLVDAAGATVAEWPWTDGVVAMPAWRPWGDRP